jgi:LPS-assembly protein
VGDTNQLTLSLSSRFLPQGSGQEWLRASIGEIFFFEKRRVFLCEEENTSIVCVISEDPSPTAHQSNLIAQADFHPHPQWSGGLFWEWDPVNQETEQAAISAQFNPNPQKIINFNYYWQKQDFAQINPETLVMGSLNQAEMSVFWPLSLHWQLLARWHYDLVGKQTLELLGGLEYNACCVAIQLVGSRYKQSGELYYPDPFATGVFAQIAFKGLSAIGYNNPDAKLKQKIPGYISLYHRLQAPAAYKGKPFFPPIDNTPY